MTITPLHYANFDTCYALLMARAIREYDTLTGLTVNLPPTAQRVSDTDLVALLDRLAAGLSLHVNAGLTEPSLRVEWRYVSKASCAVFRVRV